ncbi:MAG: hypothetical protein PHH85_08975 [Candidatus Methanoperedens sp.]|nr:hypothetical protein [Candidatus Methanoperedens sp.]
MSQTIYPGIPKIIDVTILNGQLTGTKYHYMGTTPKCGKPNPNLDDLANASAFATADDSIVTVTVSMPVSQDTTYAVLVMV